MNNLKITHKLFLFIIWIAISNVGLAQSDSSSYLLEVKQKLKKAKLIEKDRFRAYKANVFKKDKSTMDTGVFWNINAEKILLLPTDQFRKWKKNKLPEEELKFIETSIQEVRLIKIHPKSDMRKTGLAGLGIGAALGIPIGLIRQSRYNDSMVCGDNAVGPPSGNECFGGPHRLRNNITLWGIAGGIVGLIAGSERLKFTIGKGKTSNELQLEKIKKYSLLHR